MNDHLLNPITLGDIACPNRVFMAPLTRARAKQPGDIPWELNAEYYRQRASSGLLIAEATYITQQGKGYAFTPGIETDAQVEGWKLVTDAVHERGGRIVLQLWHVGRVSHTALQPNNQPPVAPSAQQSESQTYIDDTMGRVRCSMPRALETDEIPGIVEDYRRAAQNARAAGFDGVEIHGANSYLLDQFCRDGTNKRTDEFGGPIANRIKFPLMVADAVCDVWGPGRVGYRMSPMGQHSDVTDSTVDETFGTLAGELGSRGLMYLHAVESFRVSERDAENERVHAIVKDRFLSAGGSAYIGNGGLLPDQADARIAEGKADAIAFGELYISNPDLAERIAQGGPYAEPNKETYYGGGAEGYTDYPALAELDAATD
ncbi:MAG: alkene reductase [Planctomycetota bacterium]